MQTVSDWKRTFQAGAKDTSADSWIFGLNQCNIGLHLMESDFGITEQEKVRASTTAIDTPTVELPEDLIRLKKIYLTVDDRRITPESVFDDDLWQEMLENDNNVSSDLTENYFPRDNYVELYPQPVTANPLTFIYQGTSGDLFYEDDATGTISVTNDSVAVVGTGTAWDSNFVGRWLKVTSTNHWYQIASVTDTTHLSLRKKYQGKTNATATYLIGEIPYTLPSSAQHLPVSYALQQYYLFKRRDTTISKMHEDIFEKQSKVQKGLFKKRSQSVVIPSQNNKRRNTGGWSRRDLTRGLS